jgi:hypothetical protein
MYPRGWAQTDMFRLAAMDVTESLRDVFLHVVCGALLAYHAKVIVTAGLRGSHSNPDSPFNFLKPVLSPSQIV